MFEASRGTKAQACDLKLEEIKYLIYSFGIEAKRGVEFRHSTRNASRIWRIVGNGVS